MSESSLIGAVLDKAILVGVDLSKVNLADTSLNGIESFAGARLARTEFAEYVNLKDVSFAKADLSHAKLQSATLDNADFTGASLYRTRFDMSSLQNANFQRANADEASMIGTNLQDANFLRTDIDETRFDGANLTGAIFKDVNDFRSAEFLGTTCPDGVVSDDCYDEGRLLER